MNKIKGKDIMAVGLTMFAIFFGAGNLIFPPYLGRITGSEWFLGFFFFFIVDVGVSMLAIFATIQSKDFSMTGVPSRLGKKAATVVAIIIATCLAPCLAVPRTAATTFEMGWSQMFPNLSIWVFSFVFFAIVCFLTVRPSKVVDIVGNYLTPILVLCILVLLVLGVVDPIGPVALSSQVETIKEGIVNGYQTMDPLGIGLVIVAIMGATTDKGYTTVDMQARLLSRAAIVAGILLFIVYGGLTYLGATVSSGGFEEYNQAALVVALTQRLMGTWGVIMLAVIVLFACLTTAIGLTSGFAGTLEKLTNGKCKYKTTVIVMSIFSFVISNAGISVIISVAAPILSVIFPCFITMTVLMFFGKHIKNDNIIRFATIFAFIISLSDVLAGLGVPITYTKALPLAAYQCAWIVPAIIGGIIGKFIPMKKA